MTNIKMAAHGICKWCNAYILENNPGDYYHQKACEANWCIEQLKTEKDPKRIAVLEKQLERARYVGD